MICLDCTDEIAVQRIQAIPSAVRCRDCQDAQEAGGPMLTTRIAVDLLANTGWTAVAASIPTGEDWRDGLKELPYPKGDLA